MQPYQSNIHHWLQMRGAAVNTDNAPNWPTNRDFINAPVRGESESIILLQLERMAIFECNCWWRLDQNLDWILLCVLICKADGACTSFFMFSVLYWIYNIANSASGSIRAFIFFLFYIVVGTSQIHGCCSSHWQHLWILNTHSVPIPTTQLQCK